MQQPASFGKQAITKVQADRVLGNAGTTMSRSGLDIKMDLDCTMVDPCLIRL
jgi:hypothetical protein